MQEKKEGDKERDTTSAEHVQEAAESEWLLAEHLKL